MRADGAGQACRRSRTLGRPRGEERRPLAQRRLNLGQQLPHALRPPTPATGRLGPRRYHGGSGTQRSQVRTDISRARRGFALSTSKSVSSRFHQRQRRRGNPRLASMPFELPLRFRSHLNDRAHRSSFSAVPGRAGRFPTPHPAGSSSRGGPALIRTRLFEHIFVRLSTSCICVRSYKEGLTKWLASLAEPVALANPQLGCPAPAREAL